MVKLSIVIPYYQTYELTEKLLKSLIVQDYKEIEVILIDDGCNETRLDDWKGFEHIKIIHQENKGVSAARNAGIKLAQGKYIAFIDSDDMIMPYYVETLLNVIDTCNNDIIVFNWIDINTNDVIRQPKNPAVWKAIYKRNIIPMFDETLKAREDYYFQVELNKTQHSISYLDKVLYIYNSGRVNSLSWKDRNGEL